MVRRLSFQSLSAFLEWKEEEEDRSSSKFVKRTQPRTSKEGIVTYYFYCSRSGTYKPKGLSKRSLKTQGTSKLNSYCTSYMKAKQSPDNKLEVEYCSTHHNHEREIAHLTLPQHVKLLIATKVQQGVAVERILDDIRDSIVYGDTPTRMHLTSKKDIYNIRKALNVYNVEKHSSDPISVDIWVSQLQKHDDYNPVLYYKQQGKTDDSGHLDTDDFLLCLQTEFQLDMLKEFGNRAICVDSTHGTNQYNFLLITLLIIDEFGEGIPIAFAISNRETQLSLKVFFQAVHNRSGDLAPGIFMSDDAIQYWNAFKEIYGENNTRKYLCSWHVDRSWRNGLSRYIEDISAKAEIYAKLRAVMIETNHQDLTAMTQHLMSYLTLKYPRFAEYFKSNYLKRIEEWSTFYRIGTLVNTNMHLESFHRVLKYKYLNGKQNKRLDSLLNTLLKIARDKWFERLQKSLKGKVTHRILDINRRHEKAVELKSITTIEKSTDLSWKVSGYVVDKQSHDCRCSIKCRQCGVCPDLFTCTCVDFAIHSTACKHIHLVNMELCTDTDTTQSTSDHPVVNVQEESFTDICPSNTLKQLTQKVTTKANDIQIAAEHCKSASTLAAAISHLTSAQLILKSDPTLNITAVQNTAPHNASISKQRYYSTKRKRTSQGALTKPTEEEIKKIKLDLPNICSICFQQDPPAKASEEDDSDDKILWIGCSHCCLWFHTDCVYSNGSQHNTYKDFVCFLCKSE